MKNVTAVIKTFERPACCKRLVSSIRKYYPDMPIVVADDSREHIKLNGEGMFVIELPFNSGISFGRNMALNKVETEYFVLLDDDMIFDERTNIGLMVDMLEKNCLDIVGGWVDGADNRCAMLHREDGVLIASPCGQQAQDMINVDMVKNFFVGRVLPISNRGGWNGRLKLCEHTAFFWRHKGFLETGWTSRSSVGHKSEGSAFYDGFRDKGLDYFREFMKDEGISVYINMDGDRYEL